MRTLPLIDLQQCVLPESIMNEMFCPEYNARRLTLHCGPLRCVPLTDMRAIQDTARATSQSSCLSPRPSSSSRYSAREPSRNVMKALPFHSLLSALRLPFPLRCLSLNQHLSAVCPRFLHIGHVSPWLLLSLLLLMSSLSLRK